MNKYLVFLFAGLLSVGCVDLDGRFEVHEKLKLNHTTIFGNKKTKTVPAGSYKAEIKFSSKEKVKISFKGPKDVDVKIKLPSSASVPRTNGRIHLPAKQTGQRYDIVGHINTEYSSSSVMRDTESCTYTEYERHCETNCDSNGNCRRTCNRVPVTRYGTQIVTYRYDYTDRYLELEITKPNKGTIMASYQGDDRSSSKVYTFQGRCF